jgi:chaperonin cofactor prefoldin
MKNFELVKVNKEKAMEAVYVEDAVRELSRKLEDLYYRVYTMEDSIAECNARIEELSEESKDA